MFGGSQLLIVCDSQVVFADAIFKDIVNVEDFVNIAVCPLHIEFFSFKQSDHILLFCFDWKRGVDSVAACQNVLTCELWVPASLEHYVPEWFSFSHNFKQSITIFFKSQYFISTFFPCGQPTLSLACCDLPLQRLGSLDLLALAVKQIAHA